MRVRGGLLFSEWRRKLRELFHCDTGGRGKVTKTWFDAATWPLEAAVVWLATGSRQLSKAAGQLALKRRDCPNQKLPSLGHWLVVREGLARELEFVNGALYRADVRQGWRPGLPGQHHPFDKALVATCQLLRGKHATGRRGTSRREFIPGAVWRSALLVDDRKRGLFAQLLRVPDELAWQHVDVPAAVFRGLKAKRGRRPAGLSGSPRVVLYGEKTAERLKRKKALADEQSGIRPTSLKWGRPAGRRDSNTK